MTKIRQRLFCSLVLLLTGCVTQQAEPVFPGLTHLDRIWQDEQGNYYSALQNGSGEFTVHEPDTGAYYYYSRPDSEASLRKRPSHSPELSYQEGSLLLGERTLNPAAVELREIWFENAGTEFYGVLVIPESDQVLPVIVDAHGSESSSAVNSSWAPAWYAEAGFATLIFDKRGTGRSGGDYTHDFDLLASDLEAAIAAVASQPGVDASMIGVGGYSQGVFVATLAASRNPTIQFVIAAYGVIESPLIEDYLETRLHFEANYPELSWEEFEPLVLACERAFALGEDEFWSEVQGLKSQWKRRIDADDLYGTLVGDGCLRWPPIVLQLVGRSQFPPGLDWGHDPQPLVAGLNIPMIWLYGLADEDAPPETSIVLLEDWISQGKPFTLHTYEGAVHGMYQTASNSDGEIYRYKDPGYIRDLIQWLKQQRTVRQRALLSVIDE